MKRSTTNDELVGFYHPEHGFRALSVTELAALIGLSPYYVRNLMDPTHPSKILKGWVLTKDAKHYESLFHRQHCGVGGSKKVRVTDGVTTRTIEERELKKFLKENRKWHRGNAPVKSRSPHLKQVHAFYHPNFGSVRLKPRELAAQYGLNPMYTNQLSNPEHPMRFLKGWVMAIDRDVYDDLSSRKHCGASLRIDGRKLKKFLEENEDPSFLDLGSVKIDAYDFDGIVSVGILPQPGDVIITGRCIDESQEVYQTIGKYKIGNAVFFNPTALVHRGNHTEESRRNSAMHKLKTIVQLAANGVFVRKFFEDDPLQAEIIRKNELGTEVVLIQNDRVEL